MTTWPWIGLSTDRGSDAHAGGAARPPHPRNACRGGLFYDCGLIWKRVDVGPKL